MLRPKVIGGDVDGEDDEKDEEDSERNPGSRQRSHRSRARASPLCFRISAPGSVYCMPSYESRSGGKDV